MNREEKYTMKITGLTKEQLFLQMPKLSSEEKEKLREYRKRENAGEPIEYILEEAEFYSLVFFVDKRVLIPRNETEIIVEKVIKELKKPSVLVDIGTGSGCIAISILKNTPHIKKCFAIDISKDALQVADINRKKHTLEKQITLLQENLGIDTVIQKINSKDTIIITANLPYIKNEERENIDVFTKKFEPNKALFGGTKSGFELYEKLIEQIFLGKQKAREIILFIEIGFDQEKKAEDFLEQKGLKFEFFRDTNKISRIIKIIL